MKMTVQMAGAMLATCMFLSTAQAAEDNSTDAFLDNLVQAALPKSATPEGIINSGSLGVALFLLCELDKSATGETNNKELCGE